MTNTNRRGSFTTDRHIHPFRKKSLEANDGSQIHFTNTWFTSLCKQLRYCIDAIQIYNVLIIQFYTVLILSILLLKYRTTLHITHFCSFCRIFQAHLLLLSHFFQLEIYSLPFMHAKIKLLSSIYTLILKFTIFKLERNFSKC